MGEWGKKLKPRLRRAWRTRRRNNAEGAGEPRGSVSCSGYQAGDELEMVRLFDRLCYEVFRSEGAGNFFTRGLASLGLTIAVLVWLRNVQESLRWQYRGTPPISGASLWSAGPHAPGPRPGGCPH